MSLYTFLVTTANATLNRCGGWATALLDWFKRIPITINGAAKTPTFTDPITADPTVPTTIPANH